MGFHLQNGYRLSPMNLSQLQSFCMEVRNVIVNEHQKLYAAYLASECVSIMDEAVLYSEQKFRELLSLRCSFEEQKKISDPDFLNLSQGLISTVWNRTEERIKEIERTKQRDPEIDFSFNFTVIPDGDELYALIFTEQQQLISVWESFQEVSSFAYHDHSNPPDTLSKDEWENRRQVWERILNNNIPNLSGFHIECIPSFYAPIEISAILLSLPSFETRVHRESEKLLMERKFNEYKLQQSKESLDDYHTLIRQVNHIQRWMRTEEGKEELHKTQQEVQLLLKPTFTAENLLNPISSHLSLHRNVLACIKLCPNYQKVIEQINHTVHILLKMDVIQQWTITFQEKIETLHGKPLTNAEIKDISRHLWQKSLTKQSKK